MTSCVGGMVVDSCTPGTPAADDSVCNGSDDDCNGQTDEDFVSMATSCGVGACASTGSTSCVGGMVVDSCTPGTPAADDSVCNGSDDDCNGQTDEDFVPSCMGTTASTCVGGTVVTTECADADVCNGMETCSAGVCSPGTPVDTDDGDPCTDDSCDPMTGIVSHTPVPEGTSCSDGAVCNGEETCQGSCTAGVSLPSDAVAWWPGEGNGDDIFGGFHGTPTGGLSFVAGEVGQAFSFDALNDTLDLTAHTAALNFGPAATLELWLKTTSDVCRTVFSMRTDATHDQFLQIGNGCNATLVNEIVTWRYINGAVSSIVGHTTTTRTLVDGNFHHLAVTFDGTTTRIYIDGAAVTVTVAAGTDHGDWGGLPAPVNALFGARQAGATLVNLFLGQMDEMTLYHRALTPAEIAGIFLAGPDGKCDGTVGELTCTAGTPEPSGTPCEGGGMCDGAGMCVP
jgi:hypothetical protein